MGKRDRVAGILELTNHLVVGEDPSGIRARQIEQPAQQRRLVYPGQQQDVAGDDRFDERVADIARPAVRLAYERRRARIGAVEEVLLQGPAEGRSHLGEAPVRQRDHLETPGQAFSQAPPDEQRRRAKQHDLQREAGARVGIPQVLDRLGPARDFLHLVEHQECAAFSRLGGEISRGSPLLLNPLRVTQRRFVGAGITGRQSGIPHRVFDERRLADLSRARDYLDEAAWFQKPVDQFAHVRPGVFERITQNNEYFYSLSVELQLRQGGEVVSGVNCRGVPAPDIQCPAG